jgi:hypothetical protein
LRPSSISFSIGGLRKDLRQRRGTTVFYHGGLLILDEVYFVNCKFQFDSTPASLQLISAIVQGGWVRFTSLSTSSNGKDRPE